MQGPFFVVHMTSTLTSSHAHTYIAAALERKRTVDEVSCTGCDFRVAGIFLCWRPFCVIRALSSYGVRQLLSYDKYYFHKTKHTKYNKSDLLTKPLISLFFLTTRPSQSLESSIKNFIGLFCFIFMEIRISLLNDSYNVKKNNEGELI